MVVFRVVAPDGQGCSAFPITIQSVACGLQLFLASRLLWWKAAEVQPTILGGLMLEHLVDIHEKHWLDDLLRFIAVPEWYVGFVGLKNLYFMLD